MITIDIPGLVFGIIIYYAIVGLKISHQTVEKRLGVFPALVAYDPKIVSRPL